VPIPDALNRPQAGTLAAGPMLGIAGIPANKGSLEWIEKLLVEYLKEKGFLDG